MYCIFVKKIKAMKEKTKYRIVHQRGLSWLQFESKKGWRYIRDGATCKADCPKGIGWIMFPKWQIVCDEDESFFFDVWVKEYPNIQDYFNRNLRNIQEKANCGKSITYIK